MLRSICCLVLIVFIGCGQSGNVTAPTNTESLSLGKVVAQQAQHAEVVFTLRQTVTDGYIEFKYPSFEEGTDILSLSRTNSNGQASFCSGSK